jgi:SOS-response transcriptional repressor LexA
MPETWGSTGDAIDAAPLPPLTAMQWRVLGQISTYIDAHGYAPSLGELAWMCGLASKSTALHHVRKLVELGMLVRDTKIARSIRLTKRP